MSIHGLPVVYVLNINLISKTIINDLTLDINLVNSIIALNISEKWVLFMLK